MFELLSTETLAGYWNEHGTDCDDIGIAKAQRLKTLQQVVEWMKVHPWSDVQATAYELLELAKAQGINLEAGHED